MVSATWAVAVGMLGLAAAMGIGRLAFTPLMPLSRSMRSRPRRKVAGWPAANYALFTLAMGLTVD